MPKTKINSEPMLWPAEVVLRKFIPRVELSYSNSDIINSSILTFFLRKKCSLYQIYAGRISLSSSQRFWYKVFKWNYTFFISKYTICDRPSSSSKQLPPTSTILRFILITTATCVYDMGPSVISPTFFWAAFAPIFLRQKVQT